MRVLIHALHFGEYASRLAIALAAEHKVLVLLDPINASWELTPTLAKSLSDAVEVVIPNGTGAKFRRYVSGIMEARRAIAAFNPDVIHSQEKPDHVAYWSLAGPRTVPLVLTVHDHILHSDSRGRRWPILKYYYWRQTRYKADAVIVHGETIREEYLDLPEGRDRRVYGLRHGVLASEGASSEAAGRRILFFGRIVGYKGLGVLIEACELLASMGVSFELLIAGRGPDLDRYRGRLQAASWARIREELIDAEVVGQLFDSARVVALPYLDATQSGVAAIAVGRGRPVVATHVGALPEVVLHEKTGLLVPPNDVAALSKALRRVLLDDRLHATLCQGAGELGVGPLSWRAIATDTTRVYEDVLRARGVRTANGASHAQ